MNNYLKRLLQLSGVPLKENADYDFGHVEPRTHKVKPIASKPGQAGLPVRMVNNQGDNPLDDSESDVDGDFEHDLTTEDVMGDFDQDTDTDDFQEPTDIEQGHTYTLEIKGQPTPVMIEYDGNRFITFKVMSSGEYFVVTRMEFEDMMIPDEIAEAPFDAHSEEEPQKGMYVDVRNEVTDNVEDIPANLMSKNVNEDSNVSGNHFDMDTVQALHKILNRVGIPDAMIQSGDVRLTPQGYKKLAHQLTSEQMDENQAKIFCQDALRDLIDVMDGYKRNGVNEEQLDEFVGMGGNERFSYVTDTLGNVQISDAQTGADVYLQGQDAQEFLGAIEQVGDDEDAKQQVMAQYEHVMDNQKDAHGNDVDLFNR